MPSAIEINHVAKTFGPKQALKDLTLAVQTGSIYGFLGPNGAGKSTTIRCLMDFLHPDSGQMSVFGLDAHRQAVQVKRSIGYMPADNHLYPNWSASQHLAFSRRIWGKLPLADRLIDRLDLDLNVKAKHLSTGNHQKLGLVLAMAHQPKLLVLDEPTRGLDPLLQQEFENLIGDFQHQGGTVFISSHNLHEVEHICDQIGIIKDGQMVANQSMADIRALKVHLVTVTFGQKFDRSTFKLKGVDIVRAQDDQLVAKVHGDINAFITQLNKLPIKDLEITHLPLEEIFLSYYQPPQSEAQDHP